ncbi:hypothetical protein ALP16_200090 [Pseudomonas savastanoi]|uniref:Uncharacterized protein n=1 Tax=Pseudomonas savastanoi TaxID=29438 RepID=A0A3M5ZNS6_PSESS|nr:hypothetical protein ALP16_200090 [Pseudomonas savastanoi]
MYIQMQKPQKARRYSVALLDCKRQHPAICPLHQAWLMASTKSRRWSRRFEWSPPTKNDLIQKVSSQKLWSRSAFVALARNVTNLATIGRVTVAADRKLT